MTDGPPGPAVAILPARGGSKRLPRKNILPLRGRPMLHYPVRAALDSGLFASVAVSTEDAEIADCAHAAGARVVARPDEMASDTVTEHPACRHVLETLAAEGLHAQSFCCLYPTAVFVTPDDLRRAAALLADPPEADFVMGVSTYPIHPYKALRAEDGFLSPVWPVENARRSQEFPELVASNGTLYWARTTPYLERMSFYGARLKGYRLPRERAVDIDTDEDFAWARRLAELIDLGRAPGAG